MRLNLFIQIQWTFIILTHDISVSLLMFCFIILFVLFLQFKIGIGDFYLAWNWISIWILFMTLLWNLLDYLFVVCYIWLNYASCQLVNAVWYFNIALSTFKYRIKSHFICYHFKIISRLFRSNLKFLNQHIAILLSKLVFNILHLLFIIILLIFICNYILLHYLLMVYSWVILQDRISSCGEIS